MSLAQILGVRDAGYRPTYGTHHFDISFSPGQPAKYSHKLLFALFEAVDAVLTREDGLRRIRLLIGK